MQDALSRDNRGAANALRNWAAMRRVHRHVFGSQDDPRDRLLRLMVRRDAAEERILAHTTHSIRSPMVGNPFDRALSRQIAAGDREAALPPLPPDPPPPFRLDVTSVQGDVALEESARGTDTYVMTGDSVLVVREGQIATVHPDRAETRGGPSMAGAMASAEGAGSTNERPRRDVVVKGDTLGAVSALTGVHTSFRLFDRAALDSVVFDVIQQEDFRKLLQTEHRAAMALARQLVRDHRQRLAPGSPRRSCARFEVNEETQEGLRAGLSHEVFEYLAEGVEPTWRVHGSVLCRRGDFSDRVWLVRWGRLHLFRGRPEPRPEQRNWDIKSLGEKPIEELNKRQLAGFWGALLPLDDSAVGSDLDAGMREVFEARDPALRDQDRLYDELWIGSVEDRDRSRKPQPQRYDVTAIVGEGNALVYELDREEFIHRLEDRSLAMFEVCREVARGIVLHGWREDSALGAAGGGGSGGAPDPGPGEQEG